MYISSLTLFLKLRSDSANTLILMEMIQYSIRDGEKNDSRLILIAVLSNLLILWNCKQIYKST